MLLIGAAGYAAVSALYIALSALLAMSWRGSRLGGLLIAVCVVSALWGGVLAIDAVYDATPLTLVFGIEVLRAGAWLVFVSVLVWHLGLPRKILVLANLPWVLMLLAGAGLWLARQFVAFPVELARLLIPGGLMTALAGLILIEQLLRNSPADARWRIKQLIIAVGGMFVYDLFMYAQGVLFGVIDASLWDARGPVNILFVPLIALAARRNPRWDLDIFVSRQVVFYSTSLVAVGLYLILMSVGGYALLLYGGNWGGLAQIVFFVGAILVLVTLMFSTTLRARFKVFLSKHFFRNKYDYREEWLRLISTLSDFHDSSTRQIVIKALAQIVDSPSGLMWVRDEKERTYKLLSAYEIRDTVPDIDEHDPLIAFIREQRWLVDLDEYRRHPDRYGGLQLPDWLGPIDRAWLIIPLYLRQELLGIVLLTSSPVPQTLNYEDRDLLKTVGHHIAVHLAQERSDNLLAEAQQFQAYNRLTAFLMHDLNNLIAQQSLIVRNAERHKTNPEFIDDAMQTIANSVTRMKQIMEQLRTGRTESGRKKTLIKFLVSTAVDRCSERKPVPQLEYQDVIASAEVDVDVERFIMVLTHLIHNAQDATAADGTITVGVQEQGTGVLVTVNDTGSGMTAEFVRDRLFRPFDSTKGSQGMGIGAYQAREFARKMGGDLKVHSVPGQGTSAMLSIPVNS
jgi:putative PEP-CTERM system histidine kinase